MISTKLQTETVLHHKNFATSTSLDLPAKHTADAKSLLPTKRKRDTICGLGGFEKNFTIKPCPNSPYDKPFIFKPIRVIARSQLPLTFLDTSPDASFTHNRLFSATIPVLEQQDESRTRKTPPSILIARNESEKTLFAVERVQPSVFSLCKLAAWIKEKEVADLWDPSNINRYPIIPHVQIQRLTGTQWWEGATIKTTDVRPRKIARVSMLRKKPEIVRPLENTIPQQAQSVPTEAPVQQDDALPHILDLPLSVPAPQQLLETLIQQYLDAVYVSRTSLAYFAKGPMGRVRAAFTSPDEGAPPTYELVAQLRAMLLSQKAGEKKYTEKVPEMIRSLPHGAFSDEEVTKAPPKPRRSKKKIKLNKEGVYPHEEDFIKKWWTSSTTNSEMHAEETLDQRIKRRIGDLRVREALAQMILVLEITALEALATYKPPPEQADGDAATAETQGASQTKQKKRKKKLDDIQVQLELLLDKLCIWQSVDQVGILDFDTKPIQEQPNRNENEGHASSDRLQSFCVEVIIPFYISRLPEQAVMINKKLGGPAHTSPPKRKAHKAPTTSRKSGEAKEPDAKKSRRSLTRVATDTKAAVASRKPTPSLHRSATDSDLVDGIKRENSEVPLSAIPFQRSPSKGARGSMSHLGLLKGRQIDLSAPSAAAAAKLKQKKRVEEDLAEAISALKKPNRNLAAGSYAAEIEQRGLGLSNKARKPITTARKALKDVQVTATPRAMRRTKDVVQQTPQHDRNPFARSLGSDTPPAGSFCIPSSGVRPTSTFIPDSGRRGVTSRNGTIAGLAETPSRGSSTKIIDFASNCRRTIFATPAKPRDTAVTPAVAAQAVFATPMKKAPALAEVPNTPAAVVATPVKDMAAAVFQSPAIARPPTHQKEETSIFDELGWNDDDDLY